MTTKKPVYVDEIFGELKLHESEKWTVVHLKPRREKKIAQYAKNNDIVYYLPQYESEKKYSHKIIKFTKPLFPGYFFVRCDEKKRNKLIISGHIVSFLKIINESSFLNELKQIYLGRNFNAKFEKHEYLDKGYIVEFVQGPLKGLKGIVKNADNINEVVLQVSILKQAVSVKADIRVLKILEKLESYHTSLS